MSTTLLLLGSNAGNRSEKIIKATGFIEKKIGRITNKSSIYETAPWGFISPSSFLNQVLVVETRLHPNELLAAILEIEKHLGRKRTTRRYESRAIDIDILFYDQLIINTNNLQIPHPRMMERNFTMVPLMEVAGDFTHPGYQVKIKKLIGYCHDNLKVELFELANSN